MGMLQQGWAPPRVLPGDRPGTGLGAAVREEAGFTVGPSPRRAEGQGGGRGAALFS